MTIIDIFYVASALAVLAAIPKFVARLRLSRAKHPSLQGHARMSRRLARMLPFYEYDEQAALACDGAPDEIVAQRRAALARLGGQLADSSPRTIRESLALEPAISDMQFTNANRVPFQFRGLANRYLPVGNISDASSGVRVRNLDGNWSYDVSGSYGVNLLGYDFYKAAIERGTARVRELGPVLGPYHPLIAENVRFIKQLSGLDEVSFHMSGTEAVMQAVRLARFHTRRRQLVTFCGAYHGWWDGVQAGVGHQRSVDDIYMLQDVSEATLRVLRTRKDIACVLVNPLQALHPNSAASSDATLVGSNRTANFDRQAYSDWLQAVRTICTQKNIVLIFDEVFVGFRLGVGGAQEYFGVQADLVTYGKTIGGGLPVGVLAGKAELMRRYRDDRPADVCFARGTFNSHPYVMATMNEFLRHVTTPEYRSASEAALATWDTRIGRLNDGLAQRELPIRVRNLVSIGIVVYTEVSRFNWLFQYYLRAAGLSLSWVGTGRFIFSHNYTDDDFQAVCERIYTAAAAMRADGWWSGATLTTNAAIHKRILRELLTEISPLR